MSKAGWLKAIIAGALIWIAITLVAIAHQPTHAGTPVAIIETILALVLTIIACFLLRW